MRGVIPDDWQPRGQLKKAHASGSVVLSDPESVAKFGDKFIVKPKFEEETGGKGKGK